MNLGLGKCVIPIGPIDPRPFEDLSDKTALVQVTIGGRTYSLKGILNGTRTEQLAPVGSHGLIRQDFPSFLNIECFGDIIVQEREA